MQSYDYRGHRLEAAAASAAAEGESHYSEQSTLRIGESLENNSSQAKSSRHRRLSGSVPESAALTDQQGPIAGAAAAAAATEAATGYRRRSLSDSRSNNARSSGEFFAFPISGDAHNVLDVP